MRQGIRATHPGITFEENRPDRWSFTRLQYLEATLNEYAKEGWELDRMRLQKPKSYDEGILILRRRLVDE